MVRAPRTFSAGMKLLFATLALLGVSLVAGCKKNAPDEHPPIGPGAPKPDAAGTG